MFVLHALRKASCWTLNRIQRFTPSPFTDTLTEKTKTRDDEATSVFDATKSFAWLHWFFIFSPPTPPLSGSREGLWSQSQPQPIPAKSNTSGWVARPSQGHVWAFGGFVILLKGTSAVLWRHHSCYQHTLILVSTTRAWTKNPQLLSWESYKLSCPWLWIYLRFFCLFSWEIKGYK